MRDHRRRITVLLFVIVCATIPLTYVGLYLMLVSPSRKLRDDRLSPPCYAMAEPISERLFWPVHAIDRKLRPSLWFPLTYERARLRAQLQEHQAARRFAGGGLHTRLH